MWGARPQLGKGARGLLGWGLGLACALAAARCPAEPPNILLIMAEDMGPRVGAFGDSVANTPTLDALAQRGVRYTQVFTASGVCAPSRAALMTGVYPQSMGAQHMRTATHGYLAVPPAEVKAFPELLRREGYATANASKTDYQFGEPFTIWDVNAGGYDQPPQLALWRRLPQGRPFFAMINLLSTHESGLATPETKGYGIFAPFIEQIVAARARYPKVTSPQDVQVPPYYPDTPEVRASIAQHYDNIHHMDGEVAQILGNLEADGLAESTIVIWTADNGDGLPRAKRSVYDTGLQVPMIIRFPDGRAQGTVDPQLVSFIDLPTTILRLAGAEPPSYMQGRDFLAPGPALPRQYIYAGRDRMDQVPDWVRAVRGQRFKYIRNYRADLAYFRPLRFRDMFPIMLALWQGHREGSLNPLQRSYFEAPRPKEELYDTQADPHEVSNLAGDPAYAPELRRLSAAMDAWLARVGDSSRQEEAELKASLWPDGSQPQTARPVITRQGASEACCLALASHTPGASLGYRWLNAAALGPWLLYTQPLPIAPDARLEAKAIRYGYATSPLASWPPPPAKQSGD